MTKMEYPNGYYCTYMAILCREGYRNGCKECPRNESSIRKDEIKDRIKGIKESHSVIKTS